MHGAMATSSDVRLPAAADTGRRFCYVCHKPHTFCVCRLAQPVANCCAITILQHPRERHHPIGTARLARLGLQRAEVVVCWQLQAPPTLAQAADASWGVLFPSAAAHNLSQLAVSAQATAVGLPQVGAHQSAAVANFPRPKRLVVLDGTWAHARALYRANPWLAALPHYRIDPEGPDRYRIRREPRADYTSTLEAIVTALNLLEPQTVGLAALMGAFDTMIDRQVDCIAQRRAGARRRQRPRSRPQRRGVPQALVDHPERTVILFAEFMQHQDGGGRQRQLVYWTAQRLATGAFFGALVHPGTAGPTTAHLSHMQLDAGTIARASLPMATVGQQFDEFCGADPQFLAWNQATLDLLRQALKNGAPAWLLKAMFCTIQRRRRCTLEAALDTLAVVPVPTLALGRAEGRLGAAVAIAQTLLAPQSVGANGAGGLNPTPTGP